MMGLADSVDPAAAPSLSPENSALDVAHLSRMTLGERDLEREVLRLFECQAEMLLARMRAAGPQAVAAQAHTLKGSARGIGAWPLARVAEEVEAAAQGCDREGCDREGGDRARLARGLQALALAVDEVRRMIAVRLRAH
jgi:HPt (histidine-containing phosphotransfer) domain-containing protein